MHSSSNSFEGRATLIRNIMHILDRLRSDLRKFGPPQQLLIFSNNIVLHLLVIMFVPNYAAFWTALKEEP